MERLSTESSPVASCTVLVQELRKEIDIAMKSIAHNALSDFEMSLWRQEMLCAWLKRKIQGIGTSTSEQDTRSCLHDSTNALKDQLQSYEVLIRQCTRSAAVLSRVCRLHQTISGNTIRTNPQRFCYEV